MSSCVNCGVRLVGLINFMLILPGLIDFKGQNQTWVVWEKQANRKSIDMHLDM